MTVFWSVLTVIGALGATEASAVNWNEGRYAPIGIGDQRGTVWQRGIREPEPAPKVLAEARKSAKRGPSIAGRTAFDAASLSAASHANRSRRLNECAKESGHYPSGW
jgi:hypothetical protein